MRGTSALVAAALALAGIAAGAAHADPQVGNGNVEQNGTGTARNNGVGSISISTVNGVTTVMVDGKQVFGEEAERYIAEAKARSQAIRENIDRWHR
jgi:hypothetical protein